MISVLTPIGIGGPPPGWALYSRLNRKYTDLNQGAGWDEESLPYGQTPAIGSGDELATAVVTNENSYPVTPTSDGILSVDTGGNNSRQTVPWDVYYHRLRVWAGGTVAYIGNQVPQFTGVNEVIVLPKNSTITNVPLGGYWNDGEGDAITVSVVGSLFGTLSVVANELTGGTPNQNRIDAATFRGTDVADDSDDGVITIITGQVAVPDVDDAGVEGGSASASVEAGYLTPSLLTAASSSIPAGEVISQSPSAGTLVDPFSTVTITVSSGPDDGVGIISETLASEDGFPRANLSGITVQIWLADAPFGEPDVTLTNQITDASGLAEWTFPSGDLIPGEAVFYVAFAGSPPNEYTAGRVFPAIIES